MYCKKCGAEVRWSSSGQYICSVCSHNSLIDIIRTDTIEEGKAILRKEEEKHINCPFCKKKLKITVKF